MSDDPSARQPEPNRDHRPPRVARWLLMRILPADERDRIVEDVDEFHHRKWGERGGRAWYWRQVASYALRSFQLRSPGGSFGRDFVREFRGAGRALIRAPGVTIPAVLTIALALGANAAVFGVVDALIFAPLPYRDSGALAHVWLEDPSAPEPGPGEVSALAMQAWRAAEPPVDGMGTYDVYTATLLGIGDPKEVSMVRVDPDLLRRLGPRLVLGRVPDSGSEDGEEAEALPDRSAADPVDPARRP